MNQALVKLNLIPFLKIEKGNLFEEKILVFIESMMVNLETSGLIMTKKDEIIPDMKAEKNPMFHNANFEIEGQPTNKLLLVSINNDGNIIFGIFYYEDSKPVEFMKSEFIDVQKFNAIFPHIISCLK